jgi:hypothetical protein
MKKTIMSLVNGGMISPTHQIYGTTDLTLFKLMPIGNRNINKKHVDELVERLKKNPLLVVIAVNEKLEIINGQHRYCALRIINKERAAKGKDPLILNFYINEGYGPDECREYNVNGKGWNTKNISASKVQTGDKNYIIYENFKEKHNLPHNVTMALLTNDNGHSKNKTQEFKNGEFEVYDLKTANKYAVMINEITDTGIIPLGQKDAAAGVYCLALHKVFKWKTYNHDEMMKKCYSYMKAGKSTFKKLSDTKGPILQLEEVYNYRRPVNKYVSLMNEKDKLKYILKNNRNKN